MSSAFPEECPGCGTEITESSSTGVWCDPCGEYFDPAAADANAAADTADPYGPREATWAELQADHAAMWDAIAAHGPGSAEAAQASNLADATFVSWQRSGAPRQATASADQQANPEAGQ